MCQYVYVMGATFLTINQWGGALIFGNQPTGDTFLGRVGGPKSPPPLINNEWSLREAPSL